MKNVYDLAQEDTSLKRVSHKEYAGSCPRCNSTDSFHVQPDRKEDGAWMCRRCWPAETKGWGDGIEYLRQFRNMSFTAAKNYLAGEVDSTLDRVRSLQQSTSTQPGKIPGEYYQAMYEPYVKEAVARLKSSEGKAGLDYLLARGLTPETIDAAHLGYAIRNGRPCIVIPWFDKREGGYWRVSLRDITPVIPKTERYKNTLPGFSGGGMYLGDSLLRKLPTFIVEGEIDAISLAQCAGDIVNVVATGSMGNAQVPKWELRLARMPCVLVAFDREKDKGDQAAKHWLNLLNGVTPVLRYRPLEHDVNEMLTQGYDIRSWVEAGLEYLSEQLEQDTSSQPSQPSQPSQEQEPPVAAGDTPSTQNSLADPRGQNAFPAQEPGVVNSRGLATTCSQCKKAAVWYGAAAAAFCDEHWTGKNYERIERLKQDAQAAQAATAEPSELEQAIMSKLKGYNLYIGSICQCGCRLKWPVAGGMFIQCARCEPGGLWSTPTIELLRSLPFERLKRAG